MQHIAIIGMGVAGVGVLNAYRAHLSSQQLEDVTFHCFDTKESFGRGLPFRDPAKEALLNSKTDTLSVHTQDLNNDRYGFRHWLEDRQDEIPTYETRYAFGSYMKDYLKAVTQKLPVTCYYHKVQRIQFTQNKWQLILEEPSQPLPLFDRVHVCTGEMPNPDFYQLEGHAQFVKTVYPLTELPQAIQPSDRALVIGLGLTGIDVVKYLMNTRQLDKVYLFSRSNQFPLIRGDESEKLSFKYLTENNAKRQANPTFEWEEELLHKEIAYHGLSYNDFLKECYQPGLEGLKASMEHSKAVGIMTQIFSELVRTLLATAWPIMSERDRKQFKDKYDQVIGHVRNPMPKISAKDLLTYVDEGRLELLTEVKTVGKKNKEQLEVVFEDSKTLSIDWVFNATGMSLTHETALEKGFLASQLLNDHLATLDYQGGLSFVSPFYHSLSSLLGEAKGLHLHGLLIDGPMYQNNSIINIQQQAFELVKSLYKQ